MDDLQFRFLTPNIVAGLTGVPLSTLRRWQARGIVPAAGQRGRARRAGAPGRRLYSWDDVERLQKTRHLLRTRRLRLSDVKILIAGRREGPGPDLVIARPKPRVRAGRRGPTGNGRVFGRRADGRGSR